MKLHPLRAAVAALIVATVAACGSVGTSAPSAPPSAAPATFASFSADFCGAFTSLVRAIGNPDANTPIGAANGDASRFVIVLVLS